MIDHEASACSSLDQFGGYGNDSSQVPSISHAQRVWLAFLATRRDSYIIPAANCLGHKFHRRNDASVDPNRDFGYSRRDNNCFLSTTAKIFLSLMEVNIIQLVVTFHGGMVALGYEWGSRNHPKPTDNSPDENANMVLGQLMKGYAGTFRNEIEYPG